MPVELSSSQDLIGKLIFLASILLIGFLIINKLKWNDKIMEKLTEMINR